MLSLSDSAKLLSTLDSEQSDLYKQSDRIFMAQQALHNKFLLDMRKLSNQQETIARKLYEIDKGVAIAYSARSCSLTY